MLKKKMITWQSNHIKKKVGKHKLIVIKTKTCQDMK